MITVTIDDRPAQKVMRDVRGRFVKPIPGSARRISDLIREMIKKQFETEGEYGGKKWPGASTATERRKGIGGKLLIRSGKMFEKLTTDGEQDIRVTGNRIEFKVEGTPAGFHQTGTRNMPMRQVIPDPPPEDFMNRLKRVVTGYVITGEV